MPFGPIDWDKDPYMLGDALNYNDCKYDKFNFEDFDLSLSKLELSNFKFKLEKLADKSTKKPFKPKVFIDPEWHDCHLRHCDIHIVHRDDATDTCLHICPICCKVFLEDLKSFPLQSLKSIKRMRNSKIENLLRIYNTSRQLFDVYLLRYTKLTSIFNFEGEVYRVDCFVNDKLPVLWNVCLYLWKVYEMRINFEDIICVINTYEMKNYPIYTTVPENTAIYIDRKLN